MNLGSIKDKSDKRKRKNILRVTGALSLLCVGAIAVTSAITFGGSNEEETYSSSAITSFDAEIPFTVPEAEDEAVSAENVTVTSMLMPVKEASVLKGYAPSMLVYSQTLKQWETHVGIDLAANEGESVLAVLDGTVSEVTDDELMGKTVTIEHDDGFTTVYSSLGEISGEIESGTKVLRGQQIGTVGTSAAKESSDGAHLHFEVYKDGAPVNPQVYLSGFMK